MLVIVRTRNCWLSQSTMPYLPCQLFEFKWFPMPTVDPDLLQTPRRKRRPMPTKICALQSLELDSRFLFPNHFILSLMRRLISTTVKVVTPKAIAARGVQAASDGSACNIHRCGVVYFYMWYSQQHWFKRQNLSITASVHFQKWHNKQRLFNSKQLVINSLVSPLPSPPYHQH